MVFSFKGLGKKLSSQFPALYQNRYCDQEEFSIGVFSEDNCSDDVSSDKPLVLDNFDAKMYLCSIPKSIWECKTVSSGSDIYVLGEFEDHDSTVFKMYFSSTKTWKKCPLSKEVNIHFMCSFMQKLFIISCYKSPSMFYDIKANKWTSIATVMESRNCAACTVFDGRIVISGGLRKTRIQNEVNGNGYMNERLGFLHENLNSIEIYDFHENKWSYFPSMLSSRNNHSVVSIGNKMFMIGGSRDYSEVFDSFTRKFTYIKTLPLWIRTPIVNFQLRFISSYQVVNIGYKIYLFQRENDKVKLHSYDVKNEFSSFKTSVEMKNFQKLSYIKVPNT